MTEMRANSLRPEPRKFLAIAARPPFIRALTLIVLFAIACHFLAQWQLTRRSEAQLEIARIDQNYDANPVSLSKALDVTEAWRDDLRWTRVSITGSFMTEEEVLVRNRPFRGQSGYLVVTPFRSTDGSILFVNRGWVPAGANVNEASIFQSAPQDETEIVVRLLPGEDSVVGRVDQGSTVPSIQLEALSQRVDVSVSSAIYAQAYGVLDAVEQPSSFPIPVPKPERDEGPHLSYALQWYVFPLLALIAWIWAIRNELIREGQIRLPRQRLSGVQRDNDVEDSLSISDDFRQAR